MRAQTFRASERQMLQHTIIVIIHGVQRDLFELLDAFPEKKILSAALAFDEIEELVSARIVHENSTQLQGLWQNAETWRACHKNGYHLEEGTIIPYLLRMRVHHFDSASIAVSITSYDIATCMGAWTNFINVAYQSVAAKP
jgi:hypothetical protein